MKKLSLFLIALVMILFSCKPEVEKPTVVTKSVGDVTKTSAKVVVQVAADGGAEVTERGVCWSTDGTPTILDFRVKDTEGGLGSYEIAFTDLVPNTQYYVRAYATNEAGTGYGDEKTFVTEEPEGPENPEEPEEPENPEEPEEPEEPENPEEPEEPENPEEGHAWVDLGLPSGKKWATCNVGANAPEDYGDYFAWGETSPKAKYDWDTYLHWNDIDGDGCCDNGEATINSDISGNAQYDAATANWGGSWRMPTKDEMQELVVHCEWEYTQVNGVNGAKVIGPNGSCIFLPAAGGRDGSSLFDDGDYGYYWTSTPYGIGNDDRACGLDFDYGFGYVDWGYYRRSGLPVRPITE